MFAKILTKVVIFFKSNVQLQFKILRRPKYQKKIISILNTLNITEDYKSYENILIDGTWENPNYWLRLNLIFKALCLEKSNKTGILGKYQRRSIKSAFKIFNIKNYFDTKSVYFTSDIHIKKAQELINSSVSQQDILMWKLPEDIPGTFLYDSLLKNINEPTVDLQNPNLVNLVAKALHEINVAKELFNNSKYSLYICSHCIGITYGSLAWIALKNKIDVICVMGDLGSLRFFKLNSLLELKQKHDLPSKKEFKVTKSKEQKLINIGKQQLFNRLDGKSNDAGGNFAFKNKTFINKEKIVDYFNWPKNKKIITVYTQNWADYPHSLSIKNFVDFKEWFDITLEVAKKDDRFLWLFKEHPVIELYNYKEVNKVSYIINKLNNDHIKVVPNDWDSKLFMNSIDYVITANGSIAFEFSGLGKHVLIADRGRYEDYEFGLVAQSKKDYEAKLKISWWNEIDLYKSKLSALKFIGFFHCLPSWQKTLMYEDDIDGDLIYYKLESFLSKNKEALKSEIYCLRNWYNSQNKQYHNYKMLQTNDYILGNITK